MNSEALLLTVTQAGNALAVSRTTIYKLINSGRLRPVRVGAAVRFTREELERFIASLQLVKDVK